MYRPHNNSDRRRYVEEVDMQAPIHFWMEDPAECRIPLADALHSRARRLLKRDETVFEGCGPSVNIRLEWPGYRPLSRQIPAKLSHSPETNYTGQIRQKRRHVIDRVSPWKMTRTQGGASASDQTISNWRISSSSAYTTYRRAAGNLTLGYNAQKFEREAEPVNGERLTERRSSV
ncbi:hypothetical protein B0H17DRAFT_1177088 [Mycena rosella]|uniref:Uncharacterized protein n=1 Tax=Mycena rosella TaxID=1033263 RepID=A0AAD7GNG5_MYCRO|nr:hypothetical protein B0H17DRAFT_1177088 [Mycena rosella]